MNHLQKISQEDLDTIYAHHQLWLDDRKKGQRGNFSFLDLSDLCFPEKVTLKRAIIFGSRLTGMHL
ncbi:MAG: hypothetical protein LUD15_13450 [Bacteroides sp.]|nr:hypothetical protein [Bacteroides sp.]